MGPRSERVLRFAFRVADCLGLEQLWHGQTQQAQPSYLERVPTRKSGRMKTGASKGMVRRRHGEFDFNDYQNRLMNESRK